MARTSDPNWPGGYSIPQTIMPSIETGRKLARRDQLLLGTGQQLTNDITCLSWVSFLSPVHYNYYN